MAENENLTYQQLLDEIEASKDSPLTPEECDRRVEQYHKQLSAKARLRAIIIEGGLNFEIPQHPIEYCPYCGSRTFGYDKPLTCSSCGKELLEE